MIYEARGDALANVAQAEQMLVEDGSAAMLVIVEEGQLGEFRLPVQVKADFVVHGAGADECAARIRQLLWPGNEVSATDYLTVENMTINLATYQVKVGGEPLDFTYLEYALLAFLVTHPGARTRATRCCAGCGASTTTAARAPWTCTSAASAPSWAPTSHSIWKPCVAWDTSGAHEVPAFCERRNRPTLRGAGAPNLRAMPRACVPKYAAPAPSRESRAPQPLSLTYCANLCARPGAVCPSWILGRRAGTCARI